MELGTDVGIWTWTERERELKKKERQEGGEAEGRGPAVPTFVSVVSYNLQNNLNRTTEQQVG